MKFAKNVGKQTWKFWHSAKLSLIEDDWFCLLKKLVFLFIKFWSPLCILLASMYYHVLSHFLWFSYLANISLNFKKRLWISLFHYFMFYYLSNYKSSILSRAALSMSKVVLMVTPWKWLSYWSRMASRRLMQSRMVLGAKKGGWYAFFRYLLDMHNNN